MQSTKRVSAAETLAYQRAVQKGEGGRVAAMKSGVHLIDRDHPRETRAGRRFLEARTPGAFAAIPRLIRGINFEEIATLRVVRRFLGSFPAMLVFAARLAHFLGLFSRANQDQFGYPDVWCVPS